MESWVKFHSPQSISGASQYNSVAAFSLTTEGAGDLFKNIKQMEQNGFIQLVYGSSGSLWKPPDTLLISKDMIYMLWKAEI